MSDLAITPPAIIELALSNPVPVNLTLARGVPGQKGDVGEKGDQGNTGSSGLSAYQVAVAGGFVGTEAQWLASLKGETGATGAPSTVPGPKGDKGDPGEDSTVPGPKGDQGDPGDPGIDGQDGLSAYEIAVANGFVGTEAQWLASLVGEQGPQGEPGQSGGATFDQSLNTTDDVQFNSAITNSLYALNNLRVSTTESGDDTFVLGRTQGDNLSGTGLRIEHQWNNPVSGVPKALVVNVMGQAADANATLIEANFAGSRKFAVDKDGVVVSGSVPDARLSSNVALDNINNNFSVDQTFVGTNNTAPSQTAASGSSLMTRALVDERIMFGGPYVSQFLGTTGVASTGGGGSTTNTGNTWAVGNGGSPVAGSAAASIVTPGSGGFQFITPDNSLGAATAASGTGGLINFTQPFAIGFFIEPRHGASAIDVISRVFFGSATITAGVASGIGNVGFGLRLWRNSSGEYNLSLYTRTSTNISGNITSATNASPIVVTSASHNLQNGNLVEITGVGGNTAANGIWTVDKATTNAFELSGSTGNAAYTSGGVANKISPPISIPSNRVRRMFFYNRGNGTVELHLGSITSTPAITLTGMNVFSGQRFASQNVPFGVAQQSLTDATPFASTVISNFMLIQP